MQIESISVEQLKLPLVQPYHLAYGPVTCLDVLLVTVVSRCGRLGIGEATFLPGYSDETIGGAIAKAPHLVQLCLQSPALGDLDNTLRAYVETDPFLTSAFLTAGESLQRHYTGHRHRIPMIGLVNAKDPKQCEDEAAALRAQGYVAVKMKMGLQAIARDVERVRAVRRGLGPDIALRVDANQGLHADELTPFLHTLQDADLACLEQPFHAQDWSAHHMLTQRHMVPVLLDESIVRADDVTRTAQEHVARGVKFKLPKSGSVERLQSHIRLALSQGLLVIVGNGVQTDLGNLAELWAVAETGLTTAVESIGFQKLPQPLLRSSLVVSDAHIEFDDVAPQLVDDYRQWVVHSVSAT